MAGASCFTGDAVLGEGSVFIAPDPGALAGYLDGLARAARSAIPACCAPGHGPLVNDPAGQAPTSTSPTASIASGGCSRPCDAGARTVAEMLDAAWPEVPELLRPAATVTLAAHLDKLAERGPPARPACSGPSRRSRFRAAERLSAAAVAAPGG